MAQTTDDALTLAKARAYWPSTSAECPLTDAQLLTILTHELRDVVWPALVKLRAEFGLRYIDRTLVASQQLYRMPARAHGSRVAGVELLDAAGNVYKPVLKRRSDIARESGDSTETTGNLEEMWYFLSGSRVGIHPMPSSALGTLRIWYYVQPPTLVATSDCRQVATYNGSTSITAASNFPAWTGDVDITSPDADGEALGFDVGVTSIVTTTLTLSESPEYASDIAVGDWVSAAGQSCVISVPEPGYSALVDLLVARMHEALKDADGYARSVGRAKDALTGMVELLGDRVDDESETYVPMDSALWRM